MASKQQSLTRQRRKRWSALDKKFYKLLLEPKYSPKLDIVFDLIGYFHKNIDGQRYRLN